MKPRQTFQFDLAEGFPHLEHAPIEEAVIQWVARAQTTLTPDELRQQLAQRLPDYPDCQPQRSFHLGVQFEPDGSSRQIQQDAWHDFRCLSPDRRNIAQFNRDGVLFSRLRPFETWEAFSSEATRVWNIFVAMAQPVEIERLGVRFINHIAPIRLDDLPKYLKVPPKTLRDLGLPITSFLWQTRHNVPGHPFQVNVIQTIQPKAGMQTGDLGLILDVVYGA